MLVEVLDALMNHLDETLEVVLSRGDNLILDNKVRKPKFSSGSSCGSSAWVLTFFSSVPGWFLFSCVGSPPFGAPMDLWWTVCGSPQLPELLSALLAAEQKVGSSLRWRLHEKLLHRYSCLSRLLPGELLHQTFSVRIFIILTTNVSTVGVASSSGEPGDQQVTLLCFLPAVESATGTERSGSDLLHVPALQP